MRSNDVNIKVLMTEIKNGKIQLPSIQREWIWNDEKIRDIIASVISSYPIGAVLFLECDGKPDFACNPVKGVSTLENVPVKNLILDGQQRLTAIFCAMYNIDHPVEFKKGNKTEERYYYLDIGKAVEYSCDKIDAIISVPKDKKIKKSAKNKNLGLDLSTLEKEFENKMFPLNIIFDDDKKYAWENEFTEYYRNKNDNELYLQIKKEFDEFKKIFSKLNGYTVPVIYLDSDTEMDAVCKIFEKVNSSNQPLTSFDLLTAIFAKDKFNLHDDWKEIQKSTFSKGILVGFEPKNFLRACKLYVGYENKNLNFKKNIIIDLKLKDYKHCKDIVKKGFDEARELLKEEGIITKNNLPYTTQLIPLAVICALLNEKYTSVTNAADVIKQKVMKWYWCGVFSKYYENAANDSKFSGDVENVMSWINNSNEIPSLVKDFEFDFEKLKSITSNGALFNGIIALIVKNNCRDFSNGRNIKDLYSDENIPVEIHHIFPKETFQKKYNDLVESVVNKTPISKKTNAIVGGLKPSDYLEKILTGDESEGKNKKKFKKNKQKNVTTDLVTHDNLENYLSTHWINFDDLETDDFENFICNRAKYILNAVYNATGKIFSEIRDDEIKKIFFEG